MVQIDKGFEEYLCWLNVLDINSIINNLKEIPNDVDDDIKKCSIDVIKEAKKEFIKDSKKYHMPKSMLNDCKKRCDEFIRNKSLEIINDNIEKVYFPKKTEEELQEMITKMYITKKEDELRIFYIKNDALKSDERVNKWKNFFDEWLNTSIEEFNNKAKIFGLNYDGTLIEPEIKKIDIVEMKVLRSIIYFRDNKANNAELITKILEYELKNVDIKKNIKIDKKEIKKWTDYYYKWYYNNKFRCLLKRLNIFIKEKICNIQDIDDKIGIELFKNATKDRKHKNYSKNYF